MIELPGGQDTKPAVLADWGTLNTKSSRAALAQNEFSWLENLFPIAAGNLRSLYAEGSNLYTTSNPRTIISYYPFNFGATAYVAVFLDDGSAVQVQVSNGATTTIGAAATFYAGGALPACSQYQSTYLIIGSDVSSNAYWVWDGTSLFGAGTLSPQVAVVVGGQNYTSAPTLVATGGSGSGATFSTTVANGVVTTAKCTNGGSGYLLGDKITLSFSGGGSDSEAVATAVVTTAAAGAVVAVNITNGGSGYTSTPAVVFSGGVGSPTQATANATVSGGVVTAITPVQVGSCYFAPPTVTLSGGGGTGAVVTANINSAATVVSYNIVNHGSGYSSPPTVTVGPAETPVVPVAVATVTGGVVTAVTVISPGYGLGAGIGVTLTGGGGSGAVALAQIIKGQISRIDVVSGGSGYIGVPTITISSPDDPTALIPITATAAAVVTPGSSTVTSIVLGDRGAGYLRANVDIRGGNSVAHAIGSLMPFGIQATAIETYNNQVWTVANPAQGPKMSFTAPNSIWDFGTFDGGGSAPATDSFLRRALIGLKQDDGFLYRFGDSSVNVITNVTTAATGITTYNNANVDTQMGTAWRDTICSFDRAIVFANSTGVYALFGGAVQKVSDQLDGLFQNASFNTGQVGVTPTAAVMTLFNVRVYALLFTTTDPFSGTLRTIMACWDGKKWFCATQIKTMTQIALQELDSVFTAWGTDGTHLFKLFQTPSTSLTKVFQSRLEGTGSPHNVKDTQRMYLAASLLSGSSATVNLGVDTEAALASASGTTQTYTLSAGLQVLAKNANGGTGGAVSGVLLGYTCTTTAADIEFVVVERLEREQFSTRA